ncbi:MAG: hypothetical protein K1X78_22225 [Verrucomicrobiaceae bacterium]|nr:hypothetical protein [Verrucomicrobiaceae bacterium]
MTTLTALEGTVSVVREEGLLLGGGSVEEVQELVQPAGDANDANAEQPEFTHQQEAPALDRDLLLQRQLADVSVAGERHVGVVRRDHVDAREVPLFRHAWSGGDEAFEAVDFLVNVLLSIGKPCLAVTGGFAGEVAPVVWAA